MKSVTTLLYSLTVVCLDNTPHGCMFNFLVRNYSCEKRFENRSVGIHAISQRTKVSFISLRNLSRFFELWGLKPIIDGSEGYSKIRNMTPVVKGVEKCGIE